MLDILYAPGLRTTQWRFNWDRRIILWSLNIDNATGADVDVLYSHRLFLYPM